MKRINRIVISFLLVALTLCVLASCVDKPQAKQLTDLTLPELKDGQLAVIIKNGDKDYVSYTVDLKKVGEGDLTAEAVIQYLHDEADLTLVWENGGFGKYLTTIGSISQGNGKYIFLYTSNLDYESAWASSIPYELGNGVKLVEASVGVTELPVKAGDVVYFELGEYNF